MSDTPKNIYETLTTQSTTILKLVNWAQYENKFDSDVVKVLKDMEKVVNKHSKSHVLTGIGFVFTGIAGFSMLKEIEQLRKEIQELKDEKGANENA